MENENDNVSKSGSDDFNSYYSKFLADLNKQRDTSATYVPVNGATPAPAADTPPSAHADVPPAPASGVQAETPAKVPAKVSPSSKAGALFGAISQPHEGVSLQDKFAQDKTDASEHQGSSLQDKFAQDADGSTPKPYSPAIEGKDAKDAHPKARPGVLYTALVVLLTAGLTLGAVYAGLHFGVLKSAQSSDITYDYDQAEKAFAKPSGETPDWEKVFAAVAAEVVSIQVEISSGTSLGSGFVLDGSGSVITNNHVIEGKDAKIQVTLQDGRIYDASVVGTDATSDIAVIKLKDAPADLKPVTFADSETVTVGDDVMAVGNPLGLSNTATVGVISALERPVTASEGGGASASVVVTNAIQIDAAINPGNSGGPLFDGEGKVIGITSSIASTSSQNPGSIGIGFAIPSNLTQLITTQLVQNGKFEHPALGVSIQDGVVKYDGANYRAAQIKEVSASSPAGDAGMQKDDYIVAINGKPVTSTYGLMGYIRAQAIDSAIKVTYVRGDKKSEVDVKLNRKQEDALNGLSSQQPEQDDSQNGGDLFDPFDGLLGR